MKKPYLLPLEMFYQWEARLPDKVYLRQPVAGKWHEYTWRQAGNEVRRMAAHLKKTLPPGSHVAIISKNCAHWILSDLAIWMSGNISVPLYPTSAAKTVKQILEHSETKFAFIGKLDNWDDLRTSIPPNLPVISYPYDSPLGLPSWNEITAQTAPLEGNPAGRAKDRATLIYTSGTTGEPKGVIHPFQSFAQAASEICDRMKLNSDDKYFSYLPLAHVAERLLTETIALYSGGQISFAETLETFAENLRQSAPTIFLGVPRIWAKFQQGVLQKLPQKKLNVLLKIPLVSTLIRRKVQKGLGLHNLRLPVSGGAAISVDLLEWFDKIGIRIREGYGMTENLAYSHLIHSEIKFGPVGQPWPHVETKLGEDDEILIRSDCNMEGYFKNPELTKEALKDGFLCTGDQGAIDAEGFLTIVGRVKDLFKTAKGKYIAPGPIETELSTSPLLEQVCLIGDGLPQPFALGVLSENGKKLAPSELETELTKHLKRINAKLEHHEVLSKFVLIDESWTVQNGCATPTLKIKRNVIEKRYADKVATWLTAKEKILRTHLGTTK